MGACTRHRGFTLIELLVVVGIVALLAALAAPALGTLTGANARQAAGELAGAMRYMFDTAALRRQTCRIVLDLDEGTWSTECAPGGVGIARDPEKQPDEEELTRLFPDERSEAARKLLAQTKFGAFADRLARKRELPGHTRFGPVRVEGRRAAESGTAYVYFFRGGRAQRAFVPVVDGDNLYTVVVEPFTGRARVVAGPVEERE